MSDTTDQQGIGEEMAGKLEADVLKPIFYKDVPPGTQSPETISERFNDGAVSGNVFYDTIARLEETHTALQEKLQSASPKELYNELADPKSDLNVIGNAIQKLQLAEEQGILPKVSDSEMNKLEKALESAETRLEEKTIEQSPEPLPVELRMA